MIARWQVYDIGFENLVQFFKDDVDAGRAGSGGHVEFQSGHGLILAMGG